MQLYEAVGITKPVVYVRSSIESITTITRPPALPLTHSS